MCENQYSVINEVIAALDSSVSCMNDLCALFDAIKTASSEHTNEHNLSRIGGRLAKEWAFICEGEADEVRGVNSQEAELSTYDSRATEITLMNAIGICYSSINNLSALFSAIKDASDNHDRSHDIADIGCYMADSAAGYLQESRKMTEGMFKQNRESCDIGSILLHDCTGLISGQRRAASGAREDLS